MNRHAPLLRGMALGTILLLTVGLVAQPKPAAPKGAAKPAATQPTKPAPTSHTVKPAPFRVEVDLSGVFEAVTMTEIAFRPELFTSLRVQEAIAHGTAVRKGDVLVTPDLRKVDKALRDREIGVKLGELSMKLTEQSLRDAELSTARNLAVTERKKRRAEHDFDRYMKVDLPLSVESAEQTLQARKDYLAYTEEELRQLKKMYEADDITEETEEIILRRQQDALRRAQFAMKQSVIEHERTTKSSIPRRTEDAVTAHKAAMQAYATMKLQLATKLEMKRQEVLKARGDHAQLARDLASYRADMKQLTVRAPVAGVVYYGKCRRGQWDTKSGAKLTLGGAMLPNEVFMTIVAPSKLRVHVAAPEKDLHLLRKGLKGKATPAGFSEQKLNVSLAGLSLVPMAGGSFDVTLNIAGKSGPVTAGMKCKVKLLVYENKKALVVPSGAVFKDPDDAAQKVVYVKKGAKPTKRPVTAGRTHAGKTEVVEGLKAGETILLKAPK
jgi:HlyD family secretion protein